MARYTYDLFEPSDNNDESLDRLTKEFAPLHMKSWETVKKRYYDKAYNMNVSAFATLWLSRSLKVFMAYEETTPVGYLIGFQFRPMRFQYFHIFRDDDVGVDIDRLPAKRYGTERHSRKQ